ncbi:hypothetical protein D3C72_423350 [compost metagenome]
MRIGEVRQLEAPIRVGQPHGIAQRLHLACQLGAVQRAELLLLRIERRGIERAPLTIVALREVQQHRMRVQLRVGIARQVVPEAGHHQAAGRFRARAPPLGHAACGEPVLDVRQHPGHGRVVRGEEAAIRRHQRLHRYALGRTERQVRARPARTFAAVVRGGAVRQFTLQERLEGRGFDRPRQAQRFGPGAPPSARSLAVFGIVVVGRFVVAGGGRPRGHRRQRQHAASSA